MSSKATCNTKQRNKSYTQIKQNKSLIDSETHKKRQCSPITKRNKHSAHILPDTAMSSVFDIINTGIAFKRQFQIPTSFFKNKTEIRILL